MNSKSKPLCFVIMPFRREFDSIYNTIKEISENERYICVRADEIATGIISKDIFENMFNASVIVADLTEKNPNVFYELGVAHSIGGKTIMISQDKDIPFHISPEYVIFYENTIGGKKILECELRRLFKHLLSGGTIDNPAQMFLPNTPEQQVIKEVADKSKKILDLLAKSRLMELEITQKKFGKWDNELYSALEEDIKKWRKLIEKNDD